MLDALLVSAPFADPDFPALGLSLLAAMAQRKRHRCRVEYLSIPFAEEIGIDAYRMTDAQWQAVQGKLREIVKQTRFISSDDTELVQGLASGEIVAASADLPYNQHRSDGAVMTTLKLNAQIDTEGRLRLEVPLAKSKR